jgi:hypothetical protein
MKNLHIFIIAGLCLLLSSCATVTYFGDTVTPATTNVDVFYSAHDVTKPYKVIGHLNYLYGGDQATVKAKFVAYAQKIGADAIVIIGRTIDTGGKTGSDVVNADALKYTN